MNEKSKRLAAWAKAYQDNYHANWIKMYGPQSLGEGMFPSTLPGDRGGCSPLDGRAVEEKQND
jgi:hypothetical protein